MRNTHIPTILGIVAITIGVVAGVLLVEQQQYTRSRAAETSVPQNVRVSNISDTQFTVSWTTTYKTTAAIRWGNDKNLSNFITDEGTKSVHSLTITNLTPSTDYYFSILSDGVVHDANGIPWHIKTGPQLPLPGNSYTISGKVVNRLGLPVENALVFAIVGGSSPISTTTSQDGNWVLSASMARSQNLSNYLKINPETTLVELQILSDQSLPTSAKFYLKNAYYGQTIVLGEVNDFTTQQYEDIDLVPTAGINIPSPNSTTTGFGELINKDN